MEVVPDYDLMWEGAAGTRGSMVTCASWRTRASYLRTSTAPYPGHRLLGLYIPDTASDVVVCLEVISTASFPIPSSTPEQELGPRG